MNFYTELDQKAKDFIAKQKMFFTATAPQEGRLNLSPKGMDSFRILDEKHVAFLNWTGSGNETAAHLKENGRIIIMFCSFEGDPLIIRLYGQGRSIHSRDPEWEEFYPLFEETSGARQIILLEIETVQNSCGYSVPYYEYKGDREILKEWSQKKGKEGVQEYWKKKNQVSIDGLPTGIFQE